MLPAVCLFFVYAAVVTALPNPIQNEKIVNGTNAPPGKYPFQVSYQPYSQHSCAGTIINEFWVMTAAHCAYGDSAATVSILAGTVDLYGNDGVRYDADQLIIHEGYNPFDTIHDIALIKLKTPLVWSDMIAPVTLPAQDQETPGKSNATAIGWGHDEYLGNVMQFLQEIGYWIVEDQECMDINYEEVYESNICVHYPGGGKGECNGDSGGPLLVDGVQVGICSWSVKPCANPTYPGVFTEVSPYVDWIKTMTETK